VERLLRDTGFTEPTWVQTLSKPLENVREIEPLCAGYGQGAFVVVKASRPESIQSGGLALYRSQSIQ
jgi:hypothetical protein